MSSVPQAPFSSYQFEIYLAGLAGATPAYPMRYDELEAAARETVSPEAYGYVAGGASSEDTMRANLEAFRRWRIVPNMLRRVTDRDLSTELFGARLPAPVLLAPVGVQSIVHPECERAVARAAASLGIPMILSTASSTSIEDVAAENGEGERWYQLYWPRERDLAASFVQRAEKSGYSAIVVTLDTLLLAYRPRDLAQAYLPFLKGEGIAIYLSDPVFRAALAKTPEEDLNAAVFHWAGIFSDTNLGWDDLAFLREHTSLPILLKGIQSTDDAIRARDHGLDGVIVSNHGGRQVDGALGSLDALPGIAAAVGDDMPVLFDSGIRGGSDILKAIALGARAVLVGRPYVWGLALGGEDGVRHVMRSLLADFDLAMALSGYTALDQLSPDALVRAG